MHSDLEDFKTGWCGLSLGVDENEIDNLIAALQHLKRTKEHFHFRSAFIGMGGIGDIEIYFHPNGSEGSLDLDVDYRALND